MSQYGRIPSDTSEIDSVDEQLYQHRTDSPLLHKVRGELNRSSHNQQDLGKTRVPGSCWKEYIYGIVSATEYP